MTVVSLDMAYRSFREVLAGLTPTTPPSINCGARFLRAASVRRRGTKLLSRDRRPGGSPARSWGVHLHPNNAATQYAPGPVPQ